MKSGGEERLEARTKLPELREPEAPVDLMYLGSSSDQDALDHAMGVNPFAGATTSSGKGLSPEDSGDEALTILLPKQVVVRPTRLLRQPNASLLTLMTFTDSRYAPLSSI